MLSDSLLAHEAYSASTTSTYSNQNQQHPATVPQGSHTVTRPPDTKVRQSEESKTYAGGERR